MNDATVCESCGTEVAPGLLACPACHRLVHGGRLKELAASAERAESAGEIVGALGAWREAIEMIPPRTRQHAAVSARIADLSRRAGPGPAPVPTPSIPAAEDGAHAGRAGRAGVAGLGAAGLIAWKFKFAVLFLLAKAKFLALGLTKASTFFSMFLSFGYYWTLFGWRLGLGLVLSIYAHEMGHVYLLNRYGIKATAPMFIPGFGALIRVQQHFDDVRQDARVGLAGPAWGLAAALACLAGSYMLGSPVLAVVAKYGAVVNVFNLIPVWQLDGGRAFRALSRPQRWLAAAAVALAWAATGEGLLVLLTLGAAYRAAFDAAPREPDRGALLGYVGLVAVFSVLMMLKVAA